MARLRIEHLAAVGLASVVALASTGAGALTITSSPGAALADNAGDTNPVTDGIDTSSSFTGGELVTSISIDLMIDHTWVGDLAIELTSPDGTELQIFARPGWTHPDEFRGSPWGYNANLLSTNPISFLDSASTLGEQLGSGGGNTPAGNYLPDADGWSTDITTFAGFDGENAAGVWTLRVGDYAPGDLGTLVAWSLNIEAAVPEPGPGLLMTAGLLGLALAGNPRSRN